MYITTKKINSPGSSKMQFGEFQLLDSGGLPLDFQVDFRNLKDLEQPLSFTRIDGFMLVSSIHTRLAGRYRVFEFLSFNKILISIFSLKPYIQWMVT